MEHVETMRRRKDGTLFAISLTVSPVRDSEGTIVGVSSIARDITERKRNEERVQLLAREVDHRAHNLLATVLAILRLTRADDLESFRTDVSGRITALAGAHKLFTEQADGRTDLKRLVGLEFAPYGTVGESRIRLDGPDLAVSARTGQGLALVLHELTTNAAKYGALSRAEGMVEMSWTLTNGSNGAPRRGATLRWIERGGPPTSPPTRKGFGTNLIQAVVETDLRGTVHFDWQSEGLVCTLSFQRA
jgi:two-component sensor histidine kinase